MDTTFSPEDVKFQQEVRSFIHTNYPNTLRDSIGNKRKKGEELTKDDLTTWHKILGKHNGWSAPGLVNLVESHNILGLIKLKVKIIN